jgi:hypothetical protein
MMELNRRTFLQRAGLSLLTLGVSQTGLSLFNPKHPLSALANTLAVTTPRKLALLVGINNYGDIPPLKGCLTDVELQRELLIYRFGFQPEDILTLTGAQATRHQIESAFMEHLVKQAQAGDVVVFHFSGYGRQVKVPSQSEDSPTKLMPSLVPRDGNLPSQGNDVLQDTLLLMARSLPTDKLTLILDTSYNPSQNPLQGNLRGRSCSQIAPSPSPEELAWQGELQSRLKSLATDKKAAFPGLILSAAQPQQIAREIAGDGFSAGFFTYSLSQYLWQVTPNRPILVAMASVAQQLAPVMGKQQQPQLLRAGKQPLFTYFLLPETGKGAEGVIRAIKDSQEIEISLTGLPHPVLSHYQNNSCLTLATSSNPTPVLQIRSRQGLRAKAKLLPPALLSDSALQVGQLVQEWIRVLPRHLGLTVALAPSLERIERVDATSALATIGAVSSVLAAGEAAADCLLGKVKEKGGYGLFSEGGSLLVNTTGTENEAVKSAVERLIPHLEQLLAAKLWRLTLNEGSSRLALSVSLEKVEKTVQPLMQQPTRGQASRTGVSSQILGKDYLSSEPSQLLPSMAMGSRHQYRVENSGDRPLYFILLGIDAGGKAIAFANQAQPFVPPGETLIFPQTSPWLAENSPGLAQIQLIFSQAPFEKTLAALQETQNWQGNREAIANPWQVAQAVLEDLHRASAVPRDLLGGGTDFYAVDVNAWATFSFIYQVGGK